MHPDGIYFPVFSGPLLHLCDLPQKWEENRKEKKKVFVVLCGFLGSAEK